MLRKLRLNTIVLHVRDCRPKNGGKECLGSATGKWKICNSQVSRTKRREGVCIFQITVADSEIKRQSWSGITAKLTGVSTHLRKWQKLRPNLVFIFEACFGTGLGILLTNLRKEPFSHVYGRNDRLRASEAN